MNSIIILFSHFLGSFSIRLAVLSTQIFERIGYRLGSGTFAFLIGLKLQERCHKGLDARLSLGFAFQQMFQATAMKPIILVIVQSSIRISIRILLWVFGVALMIWKTSILFVTAATET